MCSRTLIALVAWCLLAAAPAFAQKSYLHPADTSSPRATLKTFIDTCNEISENLQTSGHFNRSTPENRALAWKILDCLDSSELPAFAREERAAEVAICLKEILDRVDLPRMNEIPGTEELEAEGGKEKWERYQIPGTRITIARIEDGERRHEYLFTAGTVDRAVEYFEDIRHKPYRRSGEETSPGFHQWYFSTPNNPTIGAMVDQLPDWARRNVWGIAIWEWPALFVAILLTLSLMGLCYKFQQRFALKWRDTRRIAFFLTILFPILAMCLPTLFKRFAKNELTLRGDPLYVLSFSADLVTFAASLAVVFAASTRVAELIIASPRIHPQGLDAQLIRIVSRLLSVITAVVIFIVGGQYLGFQLATLLASAGVGGFAVALAAQDTLKNLFGTLMLLTDKPFRIGERIVFGKYDGVVEDIGLRSTKLRLLTGHQASIPNDELARSHIENIGRRPYIRRLSDIHIPLDTPREKVEKALEIVRDAIEPHQCVQGERPPRIYFTDFSEDAFIIRMMYWYSPPDYWEFLAFGEELNLNIFRTFEEHGIRFSLPVRVTPAAEDGQPKPVEFKMADEPTEAQ